MGYNLLRIRKERLKCRHITNNWIKWNWHLPPTVDSDETGIGKQEVTELELESTAHKLMWLEPTWVRWEPSLPCSVVFETQREIGSVYSNPQQVIPPRRLESWPCLQLRFHGFMSLFMDLAPVLLRATRLTEFNERYGLTTSSHVAVLVRTYSSVSQTKQSFEQVLTSTERVVWTCSMKGGRQFTWLWKFTPGGGGSSLASQCMYP